MLKCVQGFVSRPFKSPGRTPRLAAPRGKIVPAVSICPSLVRREGRRLKMASPPKETTMRFMVMHKMTHEMEKGAPPTPEIMAGVGKLMEDAGKAGVFVSGEGLKPSSQRTHVAYKNGKRKVTDGPFTEPKELVGGFALMKVRSKEEALSWCDKFAAVLGDIELFL